MQILVFRSAHQVLLLLKQPLDLHVVHSDAMSRTGVRHEDVLQERQLLRQQLDSLLEHFILLQEKLWFRSFFQNGDIDRYPTCFSWVIFSIVSLAFCLVFSLDFLTASLFFCLFSV